MKFAFVPVKDHKHSLFFRIMRSLKVCGDHISDENKCVYDVYLNPYNPLSWIFILIVVPISILFNGIKDIPEILNEAKEYFKNYKKNDKKVDCHER